MPRRAVWRARAVQPPKGRPSQPGKRLARCEPWVVALIPSGNDNPFWERQANWCGRRCKSSAAKEQVTPRRSASRARVIVSWACSATQPIPRATCGLLARGGMARTRWAADAVGVHRGHGASLPARSAVDFISAMVRVSPGPHGQNSRPPKSESPISNRPNKLLGTHPLNWFSPRYRSVRLARLPNSGGISPLN